MVLICGKVGRPTASVALSTNPVCKTIHVASNLQLPIEHLYIAPNTTTPALANKTDPAEIVAEAAAFREPLRYL